MKSILKIATITFILVFVGLLIMEITESPEERTEFERKTDDYGEVVVSAEPTNTKNGLEIVLNMDTHTVDLSEDLKDVSYLRSNGDEHRPIEWLGDPPGGHHRSGRLIFENDFDDFTLYIESIGGENKKFNW